MGVKYRGTFPKEPPSPRPSPIQGEEIYGSKPFVF